MPRGAAGRAQARSGPGAFSSVSPATPDRCASRGPAPNARSGFASDAGGGKRGRGREAESGRTARSRPETRQCPEARLTPLGLGLKPLRPRRARSEARALGRARAVGPGQGRVQRGPRA